MSLEQSSAVVLRVYPWSETSLVASIYTREFGKLSVLAKGARRPKSPFEAALDLLSICRVVFVLKSADALEILTEAKLERRFRGADHGLLRLYCGYYVSELVDRLTDKGEKQPEIFDLVTKTLDDLQRIEADPGAVILRLELGMLRLLGHLPTWQQCAQCGTEVGSEQTEVTQGIVFGVNYGGVLCERCRQGARNLMRISSGARDALAEFSQEDWRKLELEGLPKPVRAAVRAVLRRYLESLLDRKFQLHEYLEELGR